MLYGELLKNTTVSGHSFELYIQNATYQNAYSSQKASLCQQVDRIEENLQNGNRGLFRDLTVGSIIASLIGSFIWWLITRIYKWIQTPQKRIGDLSEDIDLGKEPSKTQEKIDKLEEDIEKNKKIPQEEKEFLSQNILELKEKNSKVFFYRGLKYFREEPPNLNAAFEDFNSAIGQNPNNFESFYYRGIVNALMNRNRDALKDFDNVIKLKPEYHEAYTKRGEVKEL